MRYVRQENGALFPCRFQVRERFFIPCALQVSPFDPVPRQYRSAKNDNNTKPQTQYGLEPHVF